LARVLTWILVELAFAGDIAEVIGAPLKLTGACGSAGSTAIPHTGSATAFGFATAQQLHMRISAFKLFLRLFAAFNHADADWAKTLQ